MEIREFNGSKEDFKELSEMHIDLINYSEDSFLTYSHGIDELLRQLKQVGSKCFFITKNDKIAGYSILIPDNKGGVLGQSFYLKEEYRNTTLFIRAIEWLEKYVSNNFSYCTLIATNSKISSIYEKRYKKRYTVYIFTPQEKKDGN